MTRLHEPELGTRAHRGTAAPGSWPRHTRLVAPEFLAKHMRSPASALDYTAKPWIAERSGVWAKRFWSCPRSSEHEPSVGSTNRRTGHGRFGVIPDQLRAGMCWPTAPAPQASRSLSSGLPSELFLTESSPVGRRRTEMFEYRQALVRLRAGDAVRKTSALQADGPRQAERRERPTAGAQPYTAWGANGNSNDWSCGCTWSGRGKRQLPAECAACFRLASHGQRSAHQSHQPSHDGQPQPCTSKAPRRGTVGLRERIEDALLLLGRNPDAGIRNIDKHH